VGDRYDELRRAGAHDADARALALAELDDERPRRTARRIRMPAPLVHDVRYGFRMLHKNLRFTAMVVLTLALAIGANTAIFSVVYSVLLKPLPFPESGRLVEVWGAMPARGWNRASLSEANFWDFRDLNRTFEEMGALRGRTLNLVGVGFPERVDGAEVTAGFFNALRVGGVKGRVFTADEDQPGRPPVAVLSHDYWTRRFGGDPSLVGRSLTFNNQPYTVVGVLPAGTPWLNAADVFVPLVRRPDAGRSSFELTTIGRLRPGVAVDAARADLKAVARQLAERYPDANTGLEADVQPSTAWLGGDALRRALLILLGAVGFLLLIACVNVANLLLARAAGRARESAVRLAIGAQRADLVRQVLLESLLYAIAASAIGLALAHALLRLFKWLSPGGIPRLSETDLNAWVLAFTIAMAAVTCVATGLIPALQSAGTDVLPALREGDRGAKGHRRHTRVRGALVAVEVALSLVLLVGAGLLVRSLGQVLGVDRGFQTANRFVATVNIPDNYDQARVSQLMSDLLSQVRTMPDVISVAAVSGRPLGRGSTGLGIATPDQKADAKTPVPWASWRLVTTDYFRTIGVPLLRGRTFTERDTLGKPWRAIVSQRVADLLWPARDPIGQTIILWKGQTNLPGEVVGVVGNMRERGLESDPTLAVYFPMYGSGWSPPQVIAHTIGEPQALVTNLRSTLARLDPNVPVSNVATLDEVISRSVAPRRFTVVLLASLAVLAMLLAASGIYSVLAYAVSTRTAELGVRLALGATRGRLLRLVVSQGMRPVVLGLVVGLGAAAALSRLMTGLLFGVTAADPWTYVTTAIGLTMIGIAACYVPARRATEIDPVTALRYE